MPEGIRCVLIDRATGLRAREDDWDAPLECFKEGSEPQAFAPTWHPEPALGSEALIPEGGPAATDPLTGVALPADSPLSPTPASAAPIPSDGLVPEGSPAAEVVGTPPSVPSSPPISPPTLPAADGASAPVDDEATPPQPMFQ
jgi:hypothetical protein